MEATGVYWKPVWHILSDGDFELVLANAAHIKNVPGRKTDVKDAERESQRGRVTRHHRFLLGLHLQQIDALDGAIVKIDREVEAGIAHFRSAVEQVSTIPGVKDLSARMIISEISIDMSRFASDAHLISWV
jgi:transposase